VPAAKLAVQVLGQLIPVGVLVIVPCPAAGAVTVSWYEAVAGDGDGTGRNPAQPASGRIDRAHNDRNQQKPEDLMALHSKQMTDDQTNANWMRRAMRWLVLFGAEA
jgi:hypothetical protein